MDLLLERSLNHWLCSINHNAQERIEKESSVKQSDGWFGGIQVIKPSIHGETSLVIQLLTKYRL